MHFNFLCSLLSNLIKTVRAFPLINKAASQGSMLINRIKNLYSCILDILFIYYNNITKMSSECCQKIYCLISYKIFFKKVLIRPEKRK